MNEHFTKKMYWLHCLSPLHVGSGEGAEYIDNPIMREKVTGWPFVPGSSIKGIIAARYGADDENKRSENHLLKAAFGSSGDDQANAGALVFTDAYLICLPVRSLRGTFAWVTSPLVLHRLKRDYSNLPIDFLSGFSQEKVNIIYTASPETLVPEAGDNEQKKVFLEDLDLDLGYRDEVNLLGKQLGEILWADTDEGSQKWRDIFCQRFSVVHDEVFSFLAKSATQIDTRIRINPDQKTVADGALWTEESLPAETILAGVVWQDNKLLQRQKAMPGSHAIIPNDLKKFYENSVLQLGGNATIGCGQIRCIFSEHGQ